MGARKDTPFRRLHLRKDTRLPLRCHHHLRTTTWVSNDGFVQDSMQPSGLLFWKVICLFLGPLTSADVDCSCFTELGIVRWLLPTPRGSVQGYLYLVVEYIWLAAL